MYWYFKKDTIFASNLYEIYYGSPCKSHTDQPLILYLLNGNRILNKKNEGYYYIVMIFDL